MYEQSKKRLLKNTLMLFVRQLLCVLVGFYTTRIVLRQLGVDDFGIYNLVYGLVAMFEVVTGSIPVAISRFITYELGRENLSQVQKILSSSISIEIALGVVLAFAAAVSGAWFIESHMNIAPDKVEAAKIVLMFACASFALRLLIIPLDSLFIAYERMSFYAMKGVFDAFVKLAVALCLLLPIAEKLTLYAMLNTLAVLTTLLICAGYVKIKLPFYKLRPSFDVSIIKDMGAFTGWAFVGNGATIIRDQGLNIMLNLFFGSAVNAARAVSMQVSTVITTFVRNLLVSAQPQITKLYADNNITQMHSVIFVSSKFSFFLTSLAAFPVILQADYLLKIWLVNYPPHAPAFVVLFVLAALIDVVSWPFTIGLFAEGNIKTYEVALFVLNVSNLPVSLCALYCGLPPESVYVVHVSIMALVAYCRIRLSAKAYGIDARKYLKDVVSRMVSIVFFALFIPAVLTHFSGFEGVGRFLFCTTLVEVAALTCIWIIGLTPSERKYVAGKIAQKCAFLFAK